MCLYTWVTCLCPSLLIRSNGSGNIKFGITDSYFLHTESMHYGHWVSKQTVSMSADEVVMCNWVFYLQLGYFVIRVHFPLNLRTGRCICRHTGTQSAGNNTLIIGEDEQEWVQNKYVYKGMVLTAFPWKLLFYTCWYRRQLWFRKCVVWWLKMEFNLLL
jgi:hypothetical protein